MAQLLTIQVAGWNGAAHLEDTAGALADLPEDLVVIRYIDNASQDNSVEIIKKHLPHADILQLETNKGFTGAHNTAFAICTTPYVLTLDQDIVIVWSGVQKLLEAIQSNPKLGAVQGKMYRKEGNNIIDSAGIIQTLALNGKERGANEPDTGQYEERANLLAVTGGCGLYKREALKKVAYKPHVIPGRDPESRRRGSRLGGRDDNALEIFDESFFAYKDDVDLGWRLNKAGWNVEYIPVLAGYHARTMGKRGIFNWGISLKNISERINNNRTRLSLRNYIWMIAKNMTLKDYLVHGVFIKLRLFVFFALSLFSPQLFSVWGEAWRGLPNIRKKRL